MLLISTLNNNHNTYIHKQKVSIFKNYLQCFIDIKLSILYKNVINITGMDYNEMLNSVVK